MKTMRYGLLLSLLLVGFGCQPADTASNRVLATDSTTTPVNHPVAVSDTVPWVNRLWINNSENNRPGDLRIFLANGMLVMDSCWETYRLAKWERRSDSVVVWREDTAEVEAHLKMVGPKELEMRLMLVGDTLTERYQEADVPYVCPEMAR